MNSSKIGNTFHCLRSILLRSLLLSCALLGAGCHTLRNGGAPEQSFNIERDLKELARHYGERVAVANYYKNPSTAARNEVISARLVTMNLRYVQFVRQITSEKQLLDSATDILVLSLNLAGASVSGASIKTTLAARSAGVTGSKVALDKPT